MGGFFETLDIVETPEILDWDNMSFINDTNDTELYPDLLTFTYESRVEATVYCVLLFVAAAGNVPVFITLTRFRHRKSRIDFMILHLTIADLIVTFAMIPLEIAWRITVEWIAGDTFCRVMLFIRAFGPYLSSMVLVCISLDRYAAIVHPLKLNNAHLRARVMLCFAWVLSTLFSIPQSVIFHVETHPIQKSFNQCVSFNFFTRKYQEIAYNLFCILGLYGAPLSVIIFCYSRILRKIRQRSKSANNKPSRDTSTNNKSRRIILRMSDTTQVNRSRARTLKMTLIIVFTFFFCWTPYVIIDLWYLFDPASAEALDPRIQSSLFMFAVSNSCVNPLVYGNYLIRFKSLFKNLPCRKDRNKQKTPGSQVYQAGRLTAIQNDATRRVRQMEVKGEVHLELQRSTPVRRPFNRRLTHEVDDASELHSSELFDYSPWPQSRDLNSHDFAMIDDSLFDSI